MGGGAAGRWGRRAEGSICDRVGCARCCCCWRHNTLGRLLFAPRTAFRPRTWTPSRLLLMFPVPHADAPQHMFCMCAGSPGLGAPWLHLPTVHLLCCPHPHDPFLAPLHAGMAKLAPGAEQAMKEVGVFGGRALQGTSTGLTPTLSSCLGPCPAGGAAARRPRLLPLFILIPYVCLALPLYCPFPPLTHPPHHRWCPAPSRCTTAWAAHGTSPWPASTSCPRRRPLCPVSRLPAVVGYSGCGRRPSLLALRLLCGHGP